ncbi:MAG: hypothetical protein HDR80_10305 [Bacteroides sp.]|nr:hypothetical protein [Bacteroides sp.]MBD5371512.1 hypothetical protein [Bacteroides sp.]
MKKLSIIWGLAALVLGLSSCKQESDPQYHAPTSFTINEPALKNQVFRCASEMTDTETFNLFATQPDYGYSAVAQYSALVSLDPDAPVEEWEELPNETPTSAAMSIKTFELGAAINRLLDVADEDEFNANNYGNTEFKCYFKGVCELNGVEGSRIVSDNTVSYDKVMITYAVKSPGWIYICGDVQNIETNVANGFTAPSMSNYQLYKDNFAVYEPEDRIGEKLYVGVFNIVPKDPNDEKFNDGSYNESNPDACGQFRFFTELGGWKPDFSLGSNEADFYCEKITDKWAAGYTGDIVDQGLGNWGIFVEEPTPFTVVVDINADGSKIYVKEGVNTVTFSEREPEFTPVEE